MPPRKKRASGTHADLRPPPKIYTMVVYLVGGPVGRDIEGQVVSRTIQVRGDQTLKTPSSGHIQGLQQV